MESFEDSPDADRHGGNSIPRELVAKKWRNCLLQPRTRLFLCEQHNLHVIEPATFSLGNRPSIENKEHSEFWYLILTIGNTGFSIFCLAESLTVFNRSSPGTTQSSPTKLQSSLNVVSAATQSVPYAYDASLPGRSAVLQFGLFSA